MKIKSIQIIFLLLGFAFVPGKAGAQDDEPMKLSREVVLQKRHEIVQLAMTLTPAELEPFKALYHEWRRKVEALGDRKIKLVEQIMEGFDALSEEQAKSLMDEWLQIQSDELKLKKTYVNRFRKVLPQKKVARFFQLENKLDAALLFNLSGTVPLVEQ